MNRPTLTAVLLFLAASECWCGEIILDDFTDTQRYEFPHAFIVAGGVGDIAATRQISVFDNRRGDDDLVATIDINGEVPSVLVSTISSIPPVSTGGHVAFFIDEYLTRDFATTMDITDNGTNDTLFFDFDFIEGPTPPRTIRLHAVTGTAWAIAFIKDLPITDEPFTIAVPFSEFRERLGSAVQPDFADVSRIGFEPVTGGFFDFEEDEGWRFGLDAIRIGSVPEPPGNGVFLVYALAIIHTWRKRSW